MFQSTAKLYRNANRSKKKTHQNKCTQTSLFNYMLYLNNYYVNDGESTISINLKSYTRTHILVWTQFLLGDSWILICRVCTHRCSDLMRGDFNDHICSFLCTAILDQSNESTEREHLLVLWQFDCFITLKTHSILI